MKRLLKVGKAFALTTLAVIGAGTLLVAAAMFFDVANNGVPFMDQLGNDHGYGDKS